MNIFQIKAFIAITECESYTQAAKKLFSSQSNLSKAIQALETEMEAKLFVRRGNRISLTEAGRRFLESSQFMLEEYDRLRNELSLYTDTGKDKLKVAIHSSVISTEITMPMDLFMKKFPDVELNVLECKSNEDFFSLLDEYKADVAIGWVDSTEEPGYQIYPLHCDTLKLVTSKDNPLSQKSSIHLTEAKDQRFILPGDEYSYRKYIDYCRQNGMSPRISHRLTTSLGLLHMVVRHYGVAFMSQYMVPEYFRPQVSFIDLIPAYPVNLALITRNDEQIQNVHTFVGFYLSSDQQ